MPRLGHKKSRLGCRQCKARHVKCDELKPCSNCARHGAPCSLDTWDPNAPPPPPQGGSSAIPKRTKSSSNIKTKIEPSTATGSPPLTHHGPKFPARSAHDDDTPASAATEDSSPSSQSDHFTFLTRFIHQSGASQADLWVRDLELMHHWTIEAYDDLSQRGDMQHVWRVEAPKHATLHPFLMHEILAFAAFHKAYKFPDQRAQYYGFGIHHQDLTIRGVREQLQDVTAHEAAAIVATSTLLTLSVFASTGFELNCPDIPNAQGAIDGILNIFKLMQGMGNVLKLAQVHVVPSFLGPMFRDSPEAIASQPMLEELIRHIPTLFDFINNKIDLPETERVSYLQVIGHLKPVLQMSMPPRVDNRELRFLFFWPLHLQPDYLLGIKTRRPGALAILMYYAIMLFAAQGRYWFMYGWGDQLMRACLQDLDQAWLPAVRWPASFLNQNPTFSLFSDLVQSAPGVDSPSDPTLTQSIGRQMPVQVPSRHFATPQSLSHEQKQYPVGRSSSHDEQKVNPAVYQSTSHPAQ